MGDRANIVIEQGDGTCVWLYGWVPGAVSHTGLTIVETIIESS